MFKFFCHWNPSSHTHECINIKSASPAIKWFTLMIVKLISLHCQLHVCTYVSHLYKAKNVLFMYCSQTGLLLLTIYCKLLSLPPNTKTHLYRSKQAIIGEYYGKVGKLIYQSLDKTLIICAAVKKGTSPRRSIKWLKLISSFDYWKLPQFTRLASSFLWWGSVGRWQQGA